MGAPRRDSLEPAIQLVHDALRAVAEPMPADLTAKIAADLKRRDAETALACRRRYRAMMPGEAVSVRRPRRRRPWALILGALAIVILSAGMTLWAVTGSAVLAH